MSDEDLKIFGDLILKNIEEQVKHENELMLQNKRYKIVLDKIKPMLKELNIKLKDILNIGIDIKEISDILELLEEII